MEEFSDLVIVGAGASGLACAVAGARLGLKVEVLEKTDRSGQKLGLTGGRKGNLTNAASPRQMAERFDCGMRLLPLLRRFPYQRIVRFFEGIGIRTQIDNEACVWPRGTDARGVADALEAAALAAGARILVRARVERVRFTSGKWQVWTSRAGFGSRSLCLATGGASYPQTGSSGDGLRLCQDLGLGTRDWYPALVSLATEDDLSELAGITQEQVRMELVVNGTRVRSADGHFIFAHGFVSGSAVLNLSGYAARVLGTGEGKLRVDWVPDQTMSELEHELAVRREQHPKQRLVNGLAKHVSRRLAGLLVDRAGVGPDRTMAELTRAERKAVVRQLKATEFRITGTEPIERATVTGGGVCLDEIELDTCRARRFAGLYVTGELLDTWAETGGFNLHLAWASGIAAAEAVAGRELR